MKLSFEWDERKAASNMRKHRVSFEEARTIFSDPLLWTFPDEEHSTAEERYVSIGVSAAGKILAHGPLRRRPTHQLPPSHRGGKEVL